MLFMREGLDSPRMIIQKGENHSPLESNVNILYSISVIRNEVHNIIPLDLQVNR